MYDVISATTAAYPTSSNVLSDAVTIAGSVGGVALYLWRAINTRVLKPLEQSKDDLKTHAEENLQSFRGIHDELSATRKDLRRLTKQLARYEQSAEIERQLQVRERQRVADRESYNHSLERDKANG